VKNGGRDRHEYDDRILLRVALFAPLYQLSFFDVTYN